MVSELEGICLCVYGRCRMDKFFQMGSEIMDGLGLIVIHQHQNNSFYMLITNKEKTLIKMDYIDLN